MFFNMPRKSKKQINNNNNNNNTSDEEEINKPVYIINNYKAEQNIKINQIKKDFLFNNIIDFKTYN